VFDGCFLTLFGGNKMTSYKRMKEIKADIWDRVTFYPNLNDGYFQENDCDKLMYDCLSNENKHGYDQGSYIEMRLNELSKAVDYMQRNGGK